MRIYSVRQLFYKSVFPNVSPKFKWDGDTIIEGPIFIKSNNEPGRNCKIEWSIIFCSDMNLKGVHICPGLPNSTSSTQEMDEWKVRTDSNVQTLLESYVYKFSKALWDYQDDGQTEMKTVAITNDDILALINEYPGDPIKNQPFDHCAKS